MRRVLRHHHVEVALQIAAHVRVGVLVNRQGGGGVLQKQVQQPDPVFRQLRQGVAHLVADQMKAPATGRQGKNPL